MTEHTQTNEIKSIIITYITLAVVRGGRGWSASAFVLITYKMGSFMQSSYFIGFSIHADDVLHSGITADEN